MNVRLFASLAGGLLATALVTQGIRAQAPVAAPPAAPAEKAADKAAEKPADKATETTDKATEKATETARDPAERAADAPRKAARATRQPARETREAARDTAEGAREAARDTAGQARDAAKGARREGREAGRDARATGREAGETGREAGRDARETVRETRRDVRQDADLESIRAADLGIWFNTRAAADGLVIADIASQGAIARVGFQEGDRIISVNDQRVTTEAEFMTFLRADDLRNERVKIVVFRGGREQILYIQPVLIFREVVVYDPLWRYGLVIDDRSPDRIIITRVYPRTPAYYAGLRAGDVVIGLGGRRVAAVADLATAFSNPDGRVALQVNRGNRTREIEISTDAETRTTLRPNLESETRIDGRGRVEARDGDATRSERTRIERPRPNEPASRSLDAPDRLETPEKSPTTTRGEKPTTPSTPALPALKPGEAAVPPPSDAPADPPAAPAAAPKGQKPPKVSSGPQAP